MKSEQQVKAGTDEYVSCMLSFLNVLPILVSSFTWKIPQPKYVMKIKILYFF